MIQLHSWTLLKLGNGLRGAFFSTLGTIKVFITESEIVLRTIAQYGVEKCQVLRKCYYKCKFFFWSTRQQPAFYHVPACLEPSTNGHVYTMNTLITH